MFEFNGVSYPLDMDSLAVQERINRALRKMQRAMVSAEKLPLAQYQPRVAAALKTWCNETFADNGAGEALLGFDSYEKVLETSVAIGMAIGEYRMAGLKKTNTNSTATLRSMMAAAGLTEEQIEAAVKTLEQTAV